MYRYTSEFNSPGLASVHCIKKMYSRSFRQVQTLITLLSVTGSSTMLYSFFLSVILLVLPVQWEQHGINKTPCKGRKVLLSLGFIAGPPDTFRGRTCLKLTSHTASKRSTFLLTWWDCMIPGSCVFKSRS